MPTDAPAAFFSYCRDDSDFALRLAEDLKAAGANVWLDQLDIEPGTLWDREVQKALANCPRMLVILSPTSVNSDNVLDEVSFALSKQKKVIPVLYRECEIPFRLARLQHIDFRTDYAHGLKALLKTLGVEQPPEPSIPAPSIVPKESQPEVSDADEHRRAAEQARLEQERKPATESSRLAFSQFPAWMKIAVAVCGVLIVASVLYWASSRRRSSEATGEAQKQQTQAATSNPSTSGEPALSERQGAPAPKLDTRKPSTTAESPSVQGQGGLQSGTTKSEAAKAASLAAENAPARANPTTAGSVGALHVSGWAVGDKGTIMHTEDGGANWKPQRSGTSNDLFSVAFATPQSVWAVGTTILHTEDGGGSWKPQESGTELRLNFVAFATPQSGCVVGQAGIILHTENGGRTWKKQTIFGLPWLTSVAFATPQLGWAVGEGGTILHTEDGGGSWKPQESGTKAYLNSVAFPTPQLGWAVGHDIDLSGLILHTEDGGSSWKRQTSGTNRMLYSVTFATPQSGWAVGDRGTVLHTEDGGRSWQKQDSDTGAALISVAFVTPQSGWAVGDAGTIVHTEDGGGIWRSQNSVISERLWSVAFPPRR